jgi:hypothetical protein
MTNRVNSIGDLLTLTYWVKIERVEREHKLLVVDQYTGDKFFIQGKNLIDQTLSADYAGSTEKLTKTAMAEKLISLYNKPFTVHFIELSGKERTLRGKLVNPEPLLGRSYVEDLDIPLGEHRLRQVDHRTIKWLIVDGVKYTTK